MKVFYLRNCSTKILSYLLITISICVILHIWVLQHIVLLNKDIKSVVSIRNRSKSRELGFKYILAFNYLVIDKNRSVFPDLNCRVKNCIFTGDTNRFGGDHSQFDAILFDEEILHTKWEATKRSPSQLYIFNTIESSYNQPACEVFSDNFFNWTMTHRLDSTIVWSYFVVRNLSGNIVAPSISPSWNVSSDPIKPELKAILNRKRKAAAWLVSHCRADSLRDEYLLRLQEYLQQFSLQIDVYGDCSRRKCDNDDCFDMIKENYYFYMAFENSLSEDYVTEKVLNGYLNYAVPVVYGGANYSRFLPPGSYINARLIHPYNLAFNMKEAINKPWLLEKYFKWTNLYTIESFLLDHPLCKLCAALNGEKAKHAPVIKNFRLWWNGLNGMKWCLPEAYWNETANIHTEVDVKRIFNFTF